MLTRINENLIEMQGLDADALFRIERGPVTKQAIATPELLDNAVTASHYHVGGLDANGKTIVLGEPMTYHDWKGEYAWKIYQGDGDGGWVKIDEKPTEVDAIAFVYLLMQ